MTKDEIIKYLEGYADPKNVAGMARYGIVTKKAFGVSAPVLRELGKKIGKDHKLALELWKTGIHEARFIAALIDEPDKVTEKQMEKWIKDFDNWAICDSVCGALFDKTSFAHSKAIELTEREEEFVKRAGFVIMTWMAVHNKKLDDEIFIDYLEILKRESTDERNFVRKAVNWCLRTIGKRNKALNTAAIKTAIEISKIDSKAARWIAADALRELKSEKLRLRMK